MYFTGTAETDVLEIEDGEGLGNLHAVVVALGLESRTGWEDLLQEGLIGKSVVTEHTFLLGVLPQFIDVELADPLNVDRPELH